MSTERKVIKILSILTILEGILMGVTAVLCMTGVVDLSTVDAAYLNLHEGGNVFYVAVAILLVAIFELVEGWLGIQGANVPAKMLPFIIATTAAIAYYCTEFLHTLLEGAPGFGMVANLIVNAIVWYLAYKEYQKAQA